MRAISLWSALLLCLPCSLFSQAELLNTTEMFPAETGIRPTVPEIQGLSRRGDTTRIYYLSEHRGGGIQQIRGAVSTGGRSPENIPVLGYIDYTPAGQVAGQSLTWVAPPRAGANINIFLDPLVELTRQKPVAGPGEMLSYRQFDALHDELTDSEPAPISFFTPDKPVISPIPEYRTAQVGVSMGGKISFVVGTTHTLRNSPETSSTAAKYDSERVVHREGLDAAFGAPDLNFKTGFTSSVIVDASDPVSGKATVFGGLKYKKDKSKKQSFYYEFLLLTFDHTGALTNREAVTSSVPLSIQEAYTFRGRQIAPNVYERTHAAFIAHGDGNKNMEGIDPRLRRVFIVDLRTGSLVHQVDYTAASARTVPLETEQLSDGSIEIAHAYTTQGKRGFSWVRITPDGDLEQREILENDPQFRSIGFPNESLHELDMVTTQVLHRPDGSRVEFKFFFEEDDSSDPLASSGKSVRSFRGRALFVYDPDGRTTRVIGLPQMNSKEYEVLYASDAEYVIYQFRALPEGYRTAQFIRIDLADLTVTEAVLPPGQVLLTDSVDYLIDPEQRQVFLLSYAPEQRIWSLANYRF